MRIPIQLAESLKLKPASSMIWAFIDQIIISGSNFVLMLILARALQPVLFGELAIYYVILMLAVSVQFGLIGSPHNVIGPRLEVDAYQDFTRSIAHAQKLFLMVVLSGVVVVVVIDSLLHWGHVRSLIVFAITMAATLAHDFYRRVLFTEKRSREVTVLDLISYVGQVVVLAGLWAFQSLRSIEIALFVMGAFPALSALLGHSWLRTSMSGRIEHRYLVQIWQMGRWLGSSSLIGWLSAQLPALAGVWLLGPSAVGIFRAVETLLRPIGVVLALIDSVLPVRLSRLVGRKERREMDREFRRVVVAYCFGLLAICMSLLALGPGLVTVLFGEAYGAFRWLPVGLGVAYLLMGLNKIWSARARAVGLSSVLFAASVAGLVASAIMVLPLTSYLGVYGMLFCVVAAYALSLITQVTLVAKPFRSGGPD